MKKTFEEDPLAPRPNLDFSKGIRGRYAAEYKRGSILVLLEPDLTASFPDSESVNAALRSVIASRASARPAKA